MPRIPLPVFATRLWNWRDAVRVRGTYPKIYANINKGIPERFCPARLFIEWFRCACFCTKRFAES